MGNLFDMQHTKILIKKITILLALFVGPVYQQAVSKYRALEGEKECADYGDSVGTLHWKVKNIEGRLVAECELVDPIISLEYAIYWVKARENQRRRVVQECTNDHQLLRLKDGTLLCKYAPGFSDNSNVTCYVRVVDESDTKTRCVSDEIQVGALGQTIHPAPKRTTKHTTRNDTKSTQMQNQKHSSSIVRLAAATSAVSKRVSDMFVELIIDVADVNVPTTKKQTTNSRKISTRPTRPMSKFQTNALEIEVTTEKNTSTSTESVNTSPDPRTDDLSQTETVIKSSTKDDPMVMKITPALREDDFGDDEEANSITTNSEQIAIIAATVVKELKAADEKEDEGLPNRKHKEDTVYIEGWYLRVLLVAAGTVALLVAGKAIGSTLALKFYNRRARCCEGTCCQPCGGTN